MQRWKKIFAERGRRFLASRQKTAFSLLISLCPCSLPFSHVCSFSSLKEPNSFSHFPYPFLECPVDTPHFCLYPHSYCMASHSSCRSQPSYWSLIHIFHDPFYLRNVLLLNCTVMPCILFIALTKFVHTSKCVPVGGYTHIYSYTNIHHMYIC